METFKVGDPVLHNYHGAGTITQLSPSGTMAVVKYPVKDRFYFRTHAIINLKNIRNGV